MADLIADQTAPSAAGSVGEFGYEPVPVPWELKQPVSAQDQEAARRALVDAERALHIAGKVDAQRWIMTLGQLVAGRMSVDDARQKLAAYVDLIEIPFGVINDRDAIRRAAERFKFFPSFGELSDFLRGERRRLEQRLRRLRKIAGEEDPAPAARKPRWKSPLRPMLVGAGPTNDETVADPDTTGWPTDQRRAYWGARMEGKSVDEARAIATDSQQGA